MLCTILTQIAGYFKKLRQMYLVEMLSGAKGDGDIDSIVDGTAVGGNGVNFVFKNINPRT